MNESELRLNKKYHSNTFLVHLLTNIRRVILEIVFFLFKKCGSFKISYNVSKQNYNFTVRSYSSFISVIILEINDRSFSSILSDGYENKI